MKRIENFMLPEHHNNIFKEEAISSISLTRDIADKINELVAAYNELSQMDLLWKQTVEGKVNAGVVFMKDNLLNSLNDLMVLLRDQGFIDERIAYHCNVINNRLENLLGKVVEGSTTMDAEIIDARTDFTGTAWENIGEHLRHFLKLLGSPGMLTREQTGATYNNINLKAALKVGDRVYIEPIGINTDLENINYITVFGMYGDYAEDGSDTLAYILPENIRPMILPLEREYAGIRITYNLKNTGSTIAYGIIKVLTNDLSSIVYENRVKTWNHRNNNHLFEPVKLRYGAHRGCRTEAPENSLPAYELAGMNGFEWAWIAGCRQSADGTWFVMHDSTVDRTTDGTGAIKEMTDDQIAALTIDDGVNVGKYSKEELKVPTLEEVLMICKKYGMNVCFRMLSLYTNKTGIEHFRSLIKFVKEHGFENAIFSGNVEQIKMLKSFTDNWHGQVYVDTEDVQEVYNMIDTYRSHGWTNMSILASYAGTTKEVISYCHSHGYKYIVCDIPDGKPEDQIKQELLEMGADICQSGHIHN